MELVTVIRLFLGTYALFPLNALFWVVLLLVGFQYKRLAANETQLIGRPKYSIRWQVLYSALFGLAGGLLASSLLVFFGISLMEIGIIYVWPLAILLLLVHPRYLCFAYAGGLVGAFSALLTLLAQLWPGLTEGVLSGVAGIHIPGLLALIGILHLTESFLIAVSGHLFPSPLYIKTDNGVVGGYSLQKFWPLPLVGLVALPVAQAAADVVSGARMPEWWPLLASATVLADGQLLMYMLTPIVAGLGYGDLAISTPPKEKSKRSALNLGAYSLVLIGAAFAAYHYPIVVIPAALFSPLGHELLIIIGNKREFSREPLFSAPGTGVKILDVFPDSAAANTGLVPGDVILSVNGFTVNDSLSFHNVIRMTGNHVELTVAGSNHTGRLSFTHAGDSGIIVVPDRFTPVYVEVKHKHFFAALQEKLQKLRA